MLMDRDGNPIEVMFDAVTVLAGSAKLGWYEIDVQAGSWMNLTFH